MGIKYKQCSLQRILKSDRPCLTHILDTGTPNDAKRYSDVTVYRHSYLQFNGFYFFLPLTPPPPITFLQALYVPPTPSQDSKFQTPIRLHRIHPAGSRRGHQTIRLQLGHLAMLFRSRANDQSPITTCSSSENRTDTTPRAMLYSQHRHTRQLEARA